MRKNTVAALRYKSHGVSRMKQHLAHSLKPSFRTLLFFLAAGMFLFSCEENKDEPKPSSEASITSLTLTVEDTDYEVTFTGRQATLRVVPYGMPVPTTAVGVKEIVLSAGAASVDRGTQLTVTNNAITITVTAADGTTTNTYTVSLAASAGITSFTFEVADNENMALDEADRKQIVGKINQQAGTIAFDEQSAYVYLDKLKATFEVSEPGAAVQVGGADQESGVTEQDFSSPVSYVVRVQGGTETTYTVTLTKSTMATIPDASFRAKLQELFPAAFTEDQLDITHSDVVNNNGDLDISNQTPKLTSVKGVEFFTSLTNLDCRSNALESLDVSANTSLTNLSCYGNALKSLDVSKNTALVTLNCGSNSLTALDVSKNTALTGLYCQSNALDSLDVSANTALTVLYCQNNALKSLDVSANTALVDLRCGNNSLDTLDVSSNTSLTHLVCSKNNLIFLDITGMRSVRFLSIGTATATDNPLLATLRVNTALQDNAAIATMKTNRGADLTVTTVNNEGTEVCADYTPAQGGGTCNDN